MQIRSRFLTAVLTVAAVAATAALPATASAEAVVTLTNAKVTAQADRTYLNYFDTDRPTEITKVAITGLPADETIQDIDVRPLNGVMYVVTVVDADNGPLDNAGRLYTVNPVTGALALVGTSFATNLPQAATLSMDFNPQVDRVRVVASTDENYRLNPDTAVAETDTPIVGANEIVSVAYDKNVAGTASTTLYGLDPTTDSLVRIKPPNDGVIETVGVLGFDIGAPTGFDISSASNVAYFVGGAGFTELHSVNLMTGTSTKIANTTQGMFGLAVLAPSTISLATNVQDAEERTGVVQVSVVRTGYTLNGGRVDFATADGTAKAGSDYTAVSGTLHFAPGQTTKTISIPLKTHRTGAAKETFTLNLTNAAGAGLGTAATTLTMVKTVTGDKQAPSLVISDLGLKAYRYFSQYGLKTTYSCSEACTSVYTIRLGSSTYLAKGTGELRRTGVGVATAPITLLGKGRLQSAFSKTRASMIRAQFTIQVTDANGNKRVSKRYFFILR